MQHTGVQTLSCLVNYRCGIHCAHCGYAPFRNAGRPLLSPEEWGCAVSRACVELPFLETVAVAGMEPLHPHARDRTLAIVHAGLSAGKWTGIVTNGLFASGEYREEFLHTVATPLADTPLSYVDMSVDLFHMHATMRTHRMQEEAYWARMKDALDALAHCTQNLAVSVCVAEENLSHLPHLLEWVLQTMKVPRLGVLPVRKTPNNPRVTPLSKANVCELVRILEESRGNFASIVMEVLAGSVAELEELIEEGVLPCGNEVGNEWIETAGVHGEKVRLFYECLPLLTRHDARITPTGVVPRHLMHLEKETHLLEKRPWAGDVCVDVWCDIEARLAQEAGHLFAQTPSICRGKVCEQFCYGTNERCPVLTRESKAG